MNAIHGVWGVLVRDWKDFYCVAPAESQSTFHGAASIYEHYGALMLQMLLGRHTRSWWWNE